MKFSELEHFAEFLDVLFAFFRDHGITSCLYPLEDPGGLMKRLHDAEVLEKSYLGNLNQFSIDLDCPVEEADEAVHLFLFSGWDPNSQEERPLPNQLLIDMQGSYCCIMVEITDGKYPPFVRDFLEESGMLRVSYIDEEDSLVRVDEGNILTREELKDFLRRNSIRQGVKWIEVE